MFKKQNVIFMNVGDKVRLLHGKESGVVVAIKGAIVEIEIEEGFTIPVSKSEVVVVSPEESKRFQKEESPKESSKTYSAHSEVKATKGIYWAFVALNDQKFTVYCINNTDWDLPFSISTEKQGIVAGYLQSKTSVRVQEVSLAHLESWGTYIVQFLYFLRGNFEPKEPFIKKIKFRANQFKNLQDVPILNKKGYLFQIDKEEETPKIDVADITAQMFEKSTKATLVVEKPAPEVDLHIEVLAPQHTFSTPDEILKYQLEKFEKALDSAIATGMNEIVFIHGVGNGTLKYEIQKKVSKHPMVDFYKDAQKSKFGYGATYVKLK